MNYTQKMNKLIVVAHPDDEFIFFYDFIKANKNDKIMVCIITSGNYILKDGTRLNESQEFCKREGLNLICLNFDDLGKRNSLDVKKMTKELSKIKKEFNPEDVYTHSFCGEYGHAAHISTFSAVSKVFPTFSSISLFKNTDTKVKKYPNKILEFKQIFKSQLKDAFMSKLCKYSYPGFMKLDKKQVGILVSFIEDIDKVKSQQILEVYKILGQPLKKYENIFNTTPECKKLYTLLSKV